MFNYHSGVGTTAGEMEWVKLPFGGRIRWVFGGRTLREVSARYLQVPTPDNPTPAETAHTMWHNDAVDAGTSYHSGSAVYDALGQRGWTFHPDGKATVFKQLTGAGVVKRHTVYEWTYVDPANKGVPVCEEGEHVGVRAGRTGWLFDCDGLRTDAGSIWECEADEAAERRSRDD